MRELASASREQLLEVIAIQREQIEALLARVEELEGEVERLREEMRRLRRGQGEVAES